MDIGLRGCCMGDVRCWECGALPPLHDHHVVPRSKGGTRTVPLCEACHGKAHHRGGAMATTELTRAALAVKAGRGERVGELPLGSMVAEDGRTLIVDADEARTIDLIRALRADGLSIRAIAARLNADGVPARGGRWHPTTVARVLARAEAAA